jgi:hypothetical protein
MVTTLLRRQRSRQSEAFEVAGDIVRIRVYRIRRLSRMDYFAMAIASG